MLALETARRRKVSSRGFSVESRQLPWYGDLPEGILGCYAEHRVDRVSPFAPSDNTRGWNVSPDGQTSHLRIRQASAVEARLEHGRQGRPFRGEAQAAAAARRSVSAVSVRFDHQ